ncbi:hypothetical protein AQI95_18305 [Streptomyces yokosukanensis]|uniref:Uncharacterized protein n=1 Tax=Streptomyces yokosukanensis TaxID=67386 RepID=A0A124HFS8_9ACTN|nr:hypothetical protein AQI95_18305 [Streptomyces yokosukanensis]
MAAALHDPAAVQDDDEVRLAHRREPVRHDHRDGVRAPPAGAQVVPQQVGLAVRVEARGRLVEEDEQRGGAHPGAGQGQLLPLARRQVGAVGEGPAELGVEPGGQGRGHLVGAGGPQGGAYGLRVFERGRVAEADALPDGEFEPAEVLEAGGDMGAPLGRGHLGQVPPAEADPPLGHRVQPREQRDQRRLARPVVADHGDRGAGGQPQVERAERRFVAARIGEHHAVEDEIAARRHGPARPAGYAAARVVGQAQVQRDRVEGAAQPAEQPAETGRGADEAGAEEQDEHRLAGGSGAVEHRARDEVQAADEGRAEDQPARRHGERALGPGGLARAARGQEVGPVARRDLPREAVQAHFAGRCRIGGEGEEVGAAPVGLGARLLGGGDRPRLPAVGGREGADRERQQYEQRVGEGQQDQGAHTSGQKVGVLHQCREGRAELAPALAHHLGGVQELRVLVVPDVVGFRAQVHQAPVEFEADAVLQHEAYVGGDGRRLVHEDRDAEQQQSAAHGLPAVVSGGGVDHPLQAERLQCGDDVEQRGEDQDEDRAPRVDAEGGADEEAYGGERRAATAGRPARAGRAAARPVPAVGSACCRLM